jgi:flagellar hook-basal body complex protein FliE
MNPVSASSAVSKIGQLQSPTQPKGINKTEGKGSFGDLVSQFIEQTNTDQQMSDAAIKDFATGKTDDVQQVVLAMANADMSFQLFMQIRNHLIDSYNELMRMQF